MEFIAVLSYEHLDNAMFLNAFSKALARKKARGLVLHEDSEYTERLIQTGMMREDAQIRAVKDLNHRLVALFADQGVSAIGINGYQKKLITKDKFGITVDTDQFRKFPVHPVLLVSNLVFQESETKPLFYPLPELVSSIKIQLQIENTYLFSTDEKSGVLKNDFPRNIKPAELSSDELIKHIPGSFRKSHEEYLLTSAEIF
jgi:hypothetical protein